MSRIVAAHIIGNALDGARTRPAAEKVTEIPFSGPRGAILDSHASDPRLQILLHGVTKARVVLFDPQSPEKIILRKGQTGQWSIPGGNLEFGESAVRAACNEIREETGLESIPNLRLLTVLSQSERFTVPIYMWQSWGYQLRGRELIGNKVKLSTLKTAFFVAELSKPYRAREREGRRVEQLNLTETDPDSIRPAFRHLLRCWRINGRSDIPLTISHH